MKQIVSTSDSVTNKQSEVWSRIPSEPICSLVEGVGVRCEQLLPGECLVTEHRACLSCDYGCGANTSTHFRNSIKLQIAEVLKSLALTESPITDRLICIILFDDTPASKLVGMSNQSE